MSDNTNKTKRIVKNTIVLYVRMIVIMLITLYSSRIILQALGIDDYGLSNVVGGVVLLLGFLRNSLTSSTQRFLSFELGKKDEIRLKRVFSICFSTHVLISLVIIFLAETIGLWFLNTNVQIPDGRELAANYVYQFSVLSLALSVITVPYHACTISHEKMSFFAWVSILDAVLKLIFAIALLRASCDRLILYSGLLMLTNVINFILYWIYARRNFIEARYKYVWDKEMFKQIFSFSGWTIWGQLAVVFSTQGKSVLINIFYTVTVNAAMGVAQQVNAALVSLTSNFQTAFQPQLTKAYASKDYGYLKSLMYSASKMSYFLLFLASFPIMLNIEWILGIWLVKVPDFSGTFCILYIIASTLNALATPLWITIFATGNIKNYQISLSFAYFAEILVIYILFKIGFPPNTAMVVKVALNTFMVILRLLFAKKTIEFFSIYDYMRNVIAPLFISTSVTLLLSFALYNYVDFNVENKWLNTCLAVVISLMSAYYIGLTRKERVSIAGMIIRIINRKLSINK